MKYLVEKSFLKDLKPLSKDLKYSVEGFFKIVENANGFNQVPNLEKLTGFKIYYRYRIGDYRIGISYKDAQITFLRIMHRREIYRNFP